MGIVGEPGSSTRAGWGTPDPATLCPGGSGCLGGRARTRSSNGTASAKALGPDPEAPNGQGRAGRGRWGAQSGVWLERGCVEGITFRGMHRPQSLVFLRRESSQRGVWQEWPGLAPHQVDAKMTGDRGQTSVPGELTAT